MNTTLIDGEHWGKVHDARVFDQFRTLVVENHPMAVEACGEDSMVLPDGTVATQDDPQIITRKAGIPQHDVFGNRVVLAIAFCGGKGGKRRAPTISLAVLRKIGNKSDSRVDTAVGFLKLSAAGL